MHALYTARPHIYCSQVGIFSFSGKVARNFNPSIHGAMNSNKGCDSCRMRAQEGGGETRQPDNASESAPKLTNRESYISAGDVFQLRALLQLTCCEIAIKQHGNRR